MAEERTPLLQGNPAYGSSSGQSGVPPVPPAGTTAANVSAAPSAPPESMVETVEGYEGTTFQTGGYVAPPSYTEAVDAVSERQSEPPPPATHVTEGEARDSLLQLAGQNCCWGKKAARDMTVSSISSSSAYHYKLETFSEARKSTWTYEPYYGGIVDGPFNGQAPAPWSIPMQPDHMFRSHEKYCEVPHTANVKPCHDCTGKGMKTCCNCNGRGRATCTWCSGGGYQTHLHVENHHHHHGHGHGHGHHHGHGHRHGHHHGHTDVHTDLTICHHCAGTGHRLCGECHGCGQINCSACNAKGQLRFFIKLTVIWTLHEDDHIVESTALPDHLIRSAGGVIGFEESSVRVNPVSHFPNEDINSASQRLVQMHFTSFPSERILMQRHKVRIIPVSEIQADYSGKPFTFWIYGSDNQCYADQYPQQCCCGCNIL